MTAIAILAEGGFSEHDAKTATGVLRSCLFEGGEVDLKPILREPADPARRRQRLGRAMEDCVRLKPDVHGTRGNEQMSRIGG